MMESMNPPSAFNVLEAIAIGAAMGMYYDIFRIIRRLFHLRYTTIVSQDLFFWITSAIAVFFADIWISGGTVRIYFVAAVLIGWGIYAATAGTLVMFLADKALALGRKAVKFMAGAIAKSEHFQKISIFRKI